MSAVESAHSYDVWCAEQSSTSSQVAVPEPCITDAQVVRSAIKLLEAVDYDMMTLHAIVLHYLYGLTIQQVVSELTAMYRVEINIDSLRKKLSRLKKKTA
jgi:hypothetical protein